MRQRLQHFSARSTVTNVHIVTSHIVQECKHFRLISAHSALIASGFNDILTGKQTLVEGYNEVSLTAHTQTTTYQGLVSCIHLFTTANPPVYLLYHNCIKLLTYEALFWFKGLFTIVRVKVVFFNPVKPIIFDA